MTLQNSNKEKILCYSVFLEKPRNSAPISFLYSFFFFFFFMFVCFILKKVKKRKILDLLVHWYILKERKRHLS